MNTNLQSIIDSITPEMKLAAAEMEIQAYKTEYARLMLRHVVQSTLKQDAKAIERDMETLLTAISIMAGEVEKIKSASS